MPPLSESAFRSLLADCDQSAFAAFVAGLWRARGREVRREGDRIVADGRELRPVVDPDGHSPADVGQSSADVVLVTATSPPSGVAGTVVGPGDLYRMLLNDVPRDHAADLFQAHFGRPLEESAETEEAGGESASEDDAGESAPGDERRADDSPDGESGEESGDDNASDEASEDDGISTAGIAVTVVAVLVVVSASLWALFLYQPDAEPADPPFTVEDPPVDGNYRVVGQMQSTSDSGVYNVESTRTYAPGDPEVTVLRRTMGADGESTFVSYVRGNRSYNRQTWSNASAFDERRESYTWARDPVRVSNSTQSIYWIDNETDHDETSRSDALSVSPLELLPYERAGTTTYQGRNVVRYEPKTGWVGTESGHPQARVTAASGEVLVDAETGTLLYADVDATLTPARTWGEFIFGSELDVSVQYWIETGVDRPDAPPWVDGLDRAASTPENATGENRTNAGAARKASWP